MTFSDLRQLEVPNLRTLMHECPEAIRRWQTSVSIDLDNGSHVTAVDKKGYATLRQRLYYLSVINRTDVRQRHKANVDARHGKVPVQ